MYAVIETGGKQYRVEKGDILDIEKISTEAGKKVEFENVLVVSDDSGISIGTPYVEGAVVTGKVVESGKGAKIVIFKYKNKKDYRKKQGHRQPYTRVEITDIAGKGKSGSTKAAAKEESEDKKPAEAVKEEKKPAEKKAEPKKADENKETTKKKVSASWKKDELIAYADEHGIEVDPKSTKAVIIEAIEAAEK